MTCTRMRFLQRVAMNVVLVALAACGVPFPEGERRVTVLDGITCSEPVAIHNTAFWPEIETRPRDVPPVVLLHMAGYLTCRAFQEARISASLAKAAIADAPPTLLKSEESRFRAFNALEDTGWVPSSEYLRAACAGLPLLNDIPGRRGALLLVALFIREAVMVQRKICRHLASQVTQLKKNMRDIWLLRIFEQEFGFSDLLSNYSRTYAWMANQLGHLTLGLGFALILNWIAISVMVAAEQSIAFVVSVPLLTMAVVLTMAGRRLGERTILVVPICGLLMILVALKDMADAPGLSDLERLIYTRLFASPTDALAVLLALTGVMAALAGIAFGVWYTIKDTPVLRALVARLPGVKRFLPAGFAATGFCTPADRSLDALLAKGTEIYRRRESWVPTLVSTVALITLLGLAGWQAWAFGASRPLGIIVAMGMAGGAVLFLCVDGRLAALGTMAVISAGLLGLWRDPTLRPEADWDCIEPHVWWAMVIIPGLTALTYWRSLAHKRTPQVLVGIAITVSLLLCLMLSFALERETLVGLAFAVAAVAISCAKEFGSGPAARQSRYPKGA